MKSCGVLEVGLHLPESFGPKNRYPVADFIEGRLVPRADLIVRGYIILSCTMDRILESSYGIARSLIRILPLFPELLASADF